MFTYYFIAIMLITFIVWGVDKYKARNNQWRIPEKWLLGLTIIGGSYGALAGMLIFRHKIRKTMFWMVVIISCIVYTVLILNN
jgi:uncharacterized membrane protein YsdA (DUF1294 family)